MVCDVRQTPKSIIGNVETICLSPSSVAEDGELDSNYSILVDSSQFKFANVSNFSSKHL
jgi:hypothetical protein